MADKVPVSTETATPVSFTLDGRASEAAPGEMLIAAAERAGTYIPRFCYHPRMAPVGVCRMCLVEVEGPRGSTLVPSCFVPVTEGMTVVTDSEKVKKAQDGVLEFLLANHPLDCPVCDKGGECPLQDQTLAYGPGESRFVEEKRHFEKPIAISDLVLLDRERCIQCSRCTRFADEVAGEALIDFAGRGESVEVATFPGEPFSSYFSGNTVQICPVGALTATPYRFVARPWDIDQSESTCTGCSVGCQVAVQSSTDRLTRVLGVDSDPINHGWLCDKGRFGFEAVTGAHSGLIEGTMPRVTEPMVRIDGEMVPVSWGEALDAAGDGLRAAGKDVAFLGGAQFTNEGAYAFARLAKGVIGTDDVDAQFGDGLSASLVFGLPPATIDDVADACTVVTLTGDLREELPVLFLRLRASVTAGSTSLIEIANAKSALSDLARVRLAIRPGDAPAAAKILAGDDAPMAFLKNHAEGATFTSDQVDRARSLIGNDGEGVVFIIGRPSMAETEATSVAAALQFAERFPKAKFVTALRRANVRGALDLGLAPGFLPGRVTLADGAVAYKKAWGKVPANAGRSTLEVLASIANKEPSTPRALVLLGADLASDLPDGTLATTALSAKPFTIAISGHHNDVTANADVVLPVSVTHERDGSTTNVEGRVLGLAQRVVPPGQAWADWMIATALADELDANFGFTTAATVTAEIAAVAPAHVGLVPSIFGSSEAANGFLLPLGTGVARAVRPLDPMAFPGVQHMATGSSMPTPALGAGREDGLLPTSPVELLASLAADASVPQPDGYALRLVATRTLYDAGTTVAASPSLFGLVAPGRVSVNPYDLDRLGTTSGQRVRLRSARGQLEVEVVADESVSRGTVVAPFNVSLVGAGEISVSALIDVTSIVTDVRMESL